MFSVENFHKSPSQYFTKGSEKIHENSISGTRDLVRPEFELISALHRYIVCPPYCIAHTFDERFHVWNVMKMRLFSPFLQELFLS